jgi:hypothetical protein
MKEQALCHVVQYPATCPENVTRVAALGHYAVAGGNGLPPCGRRLPNAASVF